MIIKKLQTITLANKNSKVLPNAGKTTYHTCLERNLQFNQYLKIRLRSLVME